MTRFVSRLGSAAAAMVVCAGLAGCDDVNIGFGGKDRGGSSADWVKPGVDAAATASAWRECRDLAGSAVGNEADIDQDIAATRSADLERESVVQLRTQQMQENTRQHGDTVVASCMQQKGFALRR